MNYSLNQQKKAKEKLTEQAYGYFSAGTGNNKCYDSNINGYDRLRIIPSYLSGLTNVDVSTVLLDKYRIDLPVGFSPTGAHNLAHQDGEKATAIAGEAISTCMILSTWTSTPLEDVAKAAPNGLRWYQTYIYKDRAETLKYIRRAEKAGYKGIVLTVDSTMTRFKPNGDATSIIEHPGKETSNREKPSDPHDNFFEQLKLDASWSDIDWMKTITRLPIILKSILSPNDARKAVSHGVHGIIVSNRGGRQMDCLPATIDVLPDIIDAVGNKIDVYIDGGIRSGYDVFKALAIGAKAVFVGRPVLWGLANNGSDGIKELFKRFEQELVFSMALAGCETVKDINRNMVSSIEKLQSKI